MRAWVFTDPALAKQAGRFVWLSIDTEKETNAAFLAKYPIQVWPTLLVIDPTAERAVLRWPGSATVPQLERLLTDGERAWKNLGGTTPLDLLARADRLAAEGKHAEAVAALRAALVGLPAERRARALESLAMEQQLAGDAEGCARTAQSESPSLTRGPSFANLVGIGLGCAGEAPKGAAWGEAATKVLEPLAREALALPDLLADDRSGLYESLVGTRKAAGDGASVKALAKEWLAFLEKEAAKAKSPESRAAFDPHRMLAARALGEPARMVEPLKQSELELPRDYNPPARLASIYLDMGKLDEARAAAARARKLVYGPRRLRLLEVSAAVEKKAGDRAAARRFLEEGLKMAKTAGEKKRVEDSIRELGAK